MNDKNLFVAAAGVAVGVLVFQAVKSRGAQAVALVNPASQNNIVNQGSNAVITKLSSGRFLSLGDFLFSIFNPNAPGENGQI